LAPNVADKPLVNPKRLIGIVIVRTSEEIDRWLTAKAAKVYERVVAESDLVIPKFDAD
jgi:hypothetical protein